MLLLNGIVIIASVILLTSGAAVTFVVVSLVRAAPILATRTGRTLEAVVIGCPRRPQRSERRRAVPRPGLPVIGALRPA